MTKKELTPNTENKKHAGGRPSKYRAEYCLAAEAFARLGWTDVQIAEKIGVTESTLSKWKIDHPEFSEALKRGKEDPDDRVEGSLFEMANGYTYETEKALVVSDGKDVGSHVEIVKVKETIPPNTTAIIFWLKNRRSAKWRDRQEITGADGEPLNLSVSFVRPKEEGDA